MAVKTIRNAVSIGALTLAALCLPLQAMAQDKDRGRGWRNGGEGQSARSEPRGGGDSNRGGGGWQRQAPPQASPQSQQSSQPGGWQGRGNWAGNAAQTQSPAVPRPQWRGQSDRADSHQGGFRGVFGRGPAPVPAPRQAGSGRTVDDRRGPITGSSTTAPTRERENWRGGGWRDGNRDGSRDWNRDGRRDGDERWRDGRRDGDRWAENRYRGEGWRNPDRERNRYHGDYRRWDHDWRYNNRYNWSWYRNHNRHIYRMPRYYAPYRGYSYSRISIGFFLDSLFFSSRYWIDDPWRYRLPDAYGPYRWVRYYDDALLVDIYSGEVVDVIHDFFW